MASFAYLAAASLSAVAQAALSARFLPPSATFEEYHSFYGRSYERESSDGRMRRALFEQRAKAVQRQNGRPGALWTAGFNAFSDWTHDELQALQGWRATSPDRGHAGAGFLMKRSTLRRGSSLPEAVTWTGLQSMSAIDQGGCGSCWAVATSFLLRGHYEIKTGTVREFSPQQLVDCVSNPRECGGTGGCEGATVELALEYVRNISLASLATTAEAAYTASNGACSHPALLEGGVRPHSVNAGTSGAGVGLASFSRLPSNQAAPLLEALLEGPVAVAVAAGQWFLYSGGVFNSCSDKVVDHAVLVAGFGKDDGLGVKYWHILNSWGTSWGENGFMRLFRGSVEEEEAECGWDNKPQDGIECKPYPARVKVCGTCGVLYDPVTVTIDATQEALHGDI